MKGTGLRGSGFEGLACLTLIIMAAAGSVTIGEAAQSESNGRISSTRVIKLKCEYKIDPLGIDVARPRLSWQLVPKNRGAAQTAYRIRVAGSTEALWSDEALVWDSGRVGSSESIHRVYEGPPLRSRMRYYWQVRIWDEDGNPTEWSGPSFWEMGLLDPSDWQASWIEPSGQDDASASRPSPLLRSTFDVDGAVVSARAYVTSLGLYEMELNGERVGDQLFTPGWTSYRHRLQYQTYDITNQLKSGKNAVGVILGSGWYRGDLFAAGGTARNYYGDRLAVLAQLEIRYEDGRLQMVGTDKGWTSATGPIVASELYAGETYDARLERRGWSTAGHDGDGWTAVRIADRDKGVLIAPAAPPVRRIEEITPVEILHTPDGETVFDMGQNMVGWIRLRVRGDAGTEVTLRHAEVLDGEGNLYTANLRSATQTDRYILKGDGVEVFEPHFTFHGFRYVAVDGFPGELSLESLTGVVIHSDMPRTGHFESSDPMINQLQHNIVWGQKGNFLDVPTDCPQRDERLGWTGDAQVFAGTASFNMDVAGFFTKWLADLAADQYANGSVPFVVPDTLRSGTAGAGGSAAWGDAGVIVPWTVYLRYGDRRILETQYESMKAWVEYILDRADDSMIWSDGYHFGDWLAYSSDDPSDPGAMTRKDLVATAFFAHSSDILGRTARVLGKDDDAERYAALLAKIKAAFNREFVTPAGRVGSDTQTSYVLALIFDLLPEDLRPEGARRLAANVRRHNNHLTTGFVGTPHLCHVLSRFGYLSTAYDLLNQMSYPSWLYPITRGATTIWERWDGIRPDGTFQDTGMNSFNHYAYGAIGDWLYRVVAGLEVDPEEPGYRHALIQPRPGGGLIHARAALDTMYGELVSGWILSGDDFKLQVTVPANTRATVRLPHAELRKVLEGGRPLADAGGVRGADQESDAVVVRVGSGTYEFSYPSTGFRPKKDDGKQLGIDSELQELVAYEEARAILRRYLPSALGHPWLNQVMTLSIREISEFSFTPGFLTDELLQEIDRQLSLVGQSD